MKQSTWHLYRCGKTGPIPLHVFGNEETAEHYRQFLENIEYDGNKYIIEENTLEGHNHPSYYYHNENQPWTKRLYYQNRSDTIASVKSELYNQGFIMISKNENTSPDTHSRSNIQQDNVQEEQHP